MWFRMSACRRKDLQEMSNFILNNFRGLPNPAKWTGSDYHSSHADMKREKTERKRKREHGEKEKNGGGLAIGYIEDKLIELEEKDTESNDVMVLEGLIYGENIRIILTYMDCSKLKSGKRGC